ncbi:MAG: hypothetical protein K2J36_08160 [Ruminococcus sp.]|nr:hypothetical protein [Ruminococcus sp.]
MSNLFYNDIFNGKEDENILKITEDFDSGEKRQKIIQILLEIIENELTSGQRVAIKEYFFNNKNMLQIAEEQGVSVVTISKKISAGKNRIYNIMKYFIR